MKLLAIFVLLLAVPLTAAQDSPRDPGWVFYLLRTADIKLPTGVVVQRVIVSVSNCQGFYLTGLPKEWVASPRANKASYSVTFFPWPSAPGEPFNVLAVNSLDEVLLVDPLENSDGMPVLPHVSVRVEYLDTKPPVMKSLTLDEAKLDLRRWSRTGLTKAAEPTRTTVTPPADAGDRASGARGSP